METNQQNKEESPKSPEKGTGDTPQAPPKQNTKSKSKSKPEAVQVTASHDLGLVVVTH